MSKFDEFGFIFSALALLFSGFVAIYYVAVEKDLEKKLTYIALALIIAFFAGMFIGSIKVR